MREDNADVYEPEKGKGKDFWFDFVFRRVFACFCCFYAVLKVLTFFWMLCGCFLCSVFPCFYQGFPGRCYKVSRLCLKLCLGVFLSQPFGCCVCVLLVFVSKIDEFVVF